MKNQVSKFILLALFMMPTMLLAINFQEVSEAPSVWEVVWQLALITLVAAVSTAWSHVLAGTFSFKLWWKDTAWPAVLAFGISVALALIDIYVKQFDLIVELVIGQETNAYDFDALVVIAFALVPFIKAAPKKKRLQTQAKVRAANQ